MEKFVSYFSELGVRVSKWMNGILPWTELETAIEKSARENPFFTPYMQRRSLSAICERFLQVDAIRCWLSNYVPAENPVKSVIGVVMAGNIPLVGFHDLMCVLVSGSQAVVKLSSKDRYLLPVLVPEGMDYPKVKYYSTEEFEKSYLSGIDALVTMGGDGAAAYFRQTFANIPKLLRCNRFSCAILRGDESELQLQMLADDMMTYYGLGCRSVTYLLVPQDYDFKRIADVCSSLAKDFTIEETTGSYKRNRAFYTINGDSFFDSYPLLFLETQEKSLPLCVVGFERYSSAAQVERFVENNRDSIQKIYRNFGLSQKPKLDDYPDGIDTLAFCLRINSLKHG